MTSDAAWTNNVANLAQLVYIETTRPDMFNETISAILASTQKMHGLDFWYKDRVEVQVQLDTPAYIAVLDTQSLPRFRSFGEDGIIRKWDPTFNAYESNPTILPPLSTGANGLPVNPNLALAPLERIDPDAILDDYALEKVDVWYNLNGQINIKSSTLFQWLKIVYYSWPIMDFQNMGNTANPCPGYSSWIAAEFPYAIVFDAASAIFQKVGNNDVARKYDAPPDPRTGLGGGLVWSQITNLIKANVR